MVRVLEKLMITEIHDNHNITQNTFHERGQITNKVQRRACILQNGGTKKGDTTGSVEPSPSGL